VGTIGLVNAHTHMYAALAGLGMPAPDPPPRSFPEILERIWWRLDRALDERALRASARLYVAEALLAGTAVLIDHHESPSCLEGSLDVLADACQDLGMRAVLCYGATERNGGRDEAVRGLEECRRFLASNRRPLVRGAVGLHASFTVSDQTIRDAGDVCRATGAVLHVHLAEDVVDVDDARARGYAHPFDRLVTLEALPPGSILAHGVHLDAGRVREAAAHGCWLVQNPRSNRHNRVGYPAALAESPLVALGTDGFPSDMLDEAAALTDESGAHADARPGCERLAGSTRLACTYFAELDPPPGEPPVSWRRWAEDVRERCRARLVADGRVVVDDGRLVTADVELVRAEAAVEAARLWRRLGAS
jgi:cytosine/adenosine deaminase-related metal-dependent hydrolase